jgi:hypothetical protein
MNPTHPHIATSIQSCHVIELRLQLVSGAEKILLAADDEDTGH